MQNQAIFCYFKHEMQLFKVLLSLKVVKFDTKMYLNFSNFRGRTSPGGGGQAQVQNGDKCRMGGGGLAKFSLDGDPQSPPGKNPDNYLCGHDLSLSLKFFLHWDSWTITAKQHHLDLIQSMYGTVPYANFNLETQNFNKDLTRKSCTISIWRIFFLKIISHTHTKKTCFENCLVRSTLPDMTGRTALAVRPDVSNAKYHVITNVTYSCHNRDPVLAKFKHVMNIETCMLLCCDHIMLWKALDQRSKNLS